MPVRHLLCPHCRTPVFTTSEPGAHVCCPSCGRQMAIPNTQSHPTPWYLSRQGQRYGPVTLEQLKRLASQGRLLASDFVWYPGAAGWIAAPMVPGLFPEDTAIPPANSGPADSEAATMIELFSPPCETPDGPLSERGIRPGPSQSVTLGDFQILRKLGSGAMGSVYLARQRSKDRLIALKMLTQQLAERPGYLQRFYREAEAMAALDHPRIVRLYGVGEERGLHYLAMEYIEGANLTEILERQGGKLSVGDALHIVQCCAEGLLHAHQHNIIHRDIKPGNILISRLGDVKLTDLGLAKLLDEDLSLTESDTGLGTPQYVSPEQARDAKHADHRSDIYALGGVLYRMVTGILPFEEKSSLELLLAKDQGLFPAARRRNDTIPPHLDLVIDKMLARQPQRRYQTCGELIRDIKSLRLANEHLSFNPLHGPLPREGVEGLVRVEILLVEDDAANVLLAQEALTECATPSNLTVAGDPLEALALLRGQGKHAGIAPPQVIILGHHSLEGGGLELLKALREDVALSRIPMVVLSPSDQAVSLLEQQGIKVNLVVSTPEGLQRFQELLEARPSEPTAVVVRLPHRTATDQPSAHPSRRPHR